ncbi:MAG: class I SAM-dependent methyltransferase [Nitrososphaerota archaeon]
MTDSDRTQARERLKRLAAESIGKGDPTGWFDVLYRTAEGNTEAIPWAHLTTNPLLVEWIPHYQSGGASRNVLVVGCGLGDDAEAMARNGYTVTAFDISPEAIRWCQRRFPESPVRYTVANLLALPDEWSRQFDLIIESYTLQSLPENALRVQAAANLARCLAPGGSLLVICRGRDETEEQGTMPWPLTHAELAMFSQSGLREVSFEDIRNRDELSVRHFRIHYRG